MARISQSFTLGYTVEIDWLIAKLTEIKNYGNKSVTLCVLEGYEGEHEVSLDYWRDETPAEIDQRETSELVEKQMLMKKEIDELARLKAKYPEHIPEVI